MNRVCCICHMNLPKLSSDEFIKRGYSKVSFGVQSVNHTKWKPFSPNISYFCNNHTFKEKMDAIDTLAKKGNPYKFNRFDDIIC
jgi:hypothetical protein